MIYFDNEYSTVSWDEELKAVVNSDKGVYRQGDEFKLNLNKVSEAIVSYKAKKLLSNILKLKVINEGDQEWLTQVWYPQIEELGINYNAIIMPQSAITRLGVKRFDPLNNNKSRIEKSYFPNLEEAREWLRTCA